MCTRPNCKTYQLKEKPDYLISGFHSRGVLPHIKREGGAYFITFRLAGTLPKDILLKFKAEREAIVQKALAAKHPLTWHEQEELFRWYSSRVDKYLDAGDGDCWMRLPQVAEIVASAIQYHAGERFELYEWCVMPNHVHAVLRPLQDWTLSSILKGWKGYSGRKANAFLKRTGMRFWQKESFDHLVRDDADMERCCGYTAMNPVNAGLCKRPENWKWSSIHKATVS